MTTDRATIDAEIARWQKRRATFAAQAEAAARAAEAAEATRSAVLLAAKGEGDPAAVATLAEATAAMQAARQEQADSDTLIAQTDLKLAALAAAAAECAAAESRQRLETLATERLAVAEEIDEAWQELLPLYEQHKAIRVQMTQVALAANLPLANPLGLERTARQGTLGYLMRVSSFFSQDRAFRGRSFPDLERQLLATMLPAPEATEAPAPRRRCAKKGQTR